MNRIILKNGQKGLISSPSEVGQGMKTRGNGVENHAGNAINHVVLMYCKDGKIITILHLNFWLMVIS